MPKLLRITTVPLSLKVLLRGQMRFMQDNGFEVIMVSADGPELADVLAFEKCRHEIVPMTRKITPFRDLIALIRLTILLRRIKPDIVHSHTPKAGLLAMTAARLAGIPIRIHTIAGLRFMTVKGFTRKVLIWMEKLTAASATHVWPNSFSLLEYIKENRMVSERKLRVIGKGSSNGIDLTRYSPGVPDPAQILQVKEKIGFRDDLYYFLSVGRIVHDKGIDELVAAFVRCYEQNEKVRLIMVGAFEDELDPVSDKARALLLNHPGIIMAGWSDAVEHYMLIAHALLHPSHREGFPNVVLQAGAMGCPVICSRIEGNIDIVEDEVTGLLFDKGDEQQLYERLCTAVNFPGKMHALAGNLRKKIETWFDQRIVFRLLKETYSELLENQQN